MEVVHLLKLERLNLNKQKRFYYRSRSIRQWSKNSGLDLVYCLQ